jgi:signal-transduction protein with cAMP-binding, CBS, and nucleotidyltransferase domain
MDDAELTHKLMSLELFGGLEHDQVEKITRSCTKRTLAPGEVLSEAQSVDDRLWVFLEGALHVESADGVLLSLVTDVRIFGEMGVLVGLTRSSRVVADQESRILELTGEALQGLVEEDPDLAQRMLANLCMLLYSRLRGANQEIEGLRGSRDQLRTRLAEVAPDGPLIKG